MGHAHVIEYAFDIYSFSFRSSTFYTFSYLRYLNLSLLCIRHDECNVMEWFMPGLLKMPFTYTIELQWPKQVWNH